MKLYLYLSLPSSSPISGFGVFPYLIQVLLVHMTLEGGDGVYLYSVVFDVEVAGGPAKISGGKVSGALLEADHPGFVQFSASLHHQLLPVQLQRRIHLQKNMSIVRSNLLFCFQISSRYEGSALLSR